jgi:hypothetical protein
MSSGGLLTEILVLLERFDQDLIGFDFKTHFGTLVLKSKTFHQK